LGAGGEAWGESLWRAAPNREFREAAAIVPAATLQEEAETMPIKIFKTNKTMRTVGASWERRLAAVILAGALAVPAVAGTARAQERDHDHWRGGEYPRFHEFDLDHWRSAHWWHGFHEGRDGWWWVLDGAWYWYPAPVYPYPDPYRPPVVVVPSAPAAGPLWYFCPNPQGYYPYVANCPTPWQPVTPTPGPR
jgi:hypothetical protein